MIGRGNLKLYSFKGRICFLRIDGCCFVFKNICGFSEDINDSFMLRVIEKMFSEVCFRDVCCIFILEVVYKLDVGVDVIYNICDKGILFLRRN